MLVPLFVPVEPAVLVPAGRATVGTVEDVEFVPFVELPVLVVLGP